MQTITLKARADHNGVVKLEIPTNLADQEMEIVLVMQRLEGQAVDKMGYPIGYFDETYGSPPRRPPDQGRSLSPDAIPCR